MTFDRLIFGRKARGCKVDPETRQTIVMAKHIGDIAYDLIGDTAITQDSEVRTFSRERILNPVLEPALNEVGENSELIERTFDKKYVKLD